MVSSNFDYPLYKHKAAYEHLTKVDPDLKDLFNQYGYPQSWQRQASFGTLVHMILEQQVSVASAQASFDKLLAILNPPKPKDFLGLSDETLKSCGFSRQKTRYTRGLAAALINGELNLEALPHLSDKDVQTELTKIVGIGSWTANIYLLEVLERPDILPAKDLALQVAVQKLKKLEARPKADELATIAEPWQPYRSAATWLLWHDYLSS